MSDVDIDYVRVRAKAEMGMAASAKCQPSRLAHLELERRYLTLCCGAAEPADCRQCDLRPECATVLAVRSAA